MLSDPELVAACTPSFDPNHQIMQQNNQIAGHGIGNCKRHSTSISALSNLVSAFEGNYCDGGGGGGGGGCANNRRTPTAAPPATTYAHYQKYCKKWNETVPVVRSTPASSAAAAAAMGVCCNNRFKMNAPNECTCSTFKNHSTSKYQDHCTMDSHKRPSTGYYSVYERRNRNIAEEDDSTYPALLEREFTSLHRNIPALRRSGIDTSTIRQHFYPDGDWGWIICGLSFLAHVLTTGLQLSYGLLLFYALQHLHHTNDIEWLGALSWSVSMITASLLATLCRKKSTRLLAVVGGLILPLGTLFTSFATELGQIIFSYGIVIGIGASMVRESSTIMLGNYFKKRRQFVEVVAMSGEGVGIAYFSVILKEGVGKMGWRLGLQMVALMTSLCFFMGLLYRPASLYHPQRRAIQHLKNQRKKVKEKKLTKSPPLLTTRTLKKHLLNLLPVKSNTIKILTLSSGVASFGIYTPVFCMSLHAAKEGSDIQDIVLLQTFLGMSIALGTVLAGTVIHQRPLKFRNPLFSSHIFPQIFLFTMAVAILFLSFVLSYKAISVLCWIYGIGFGGFRYSFKMLVLERVKSKYFTRAWGLIKGVEAVPVLISIPLTTFLNDYSLKYGRAGYYICSAATAIAAILLFFIGYSNSRQNLNGTECGGGGGGGGAAGFTLRKYDDDNDLEYSAGNHNNFCSHDHPPVVHCTGTKQKKCIPCHQRSSLSPQLAGTYPNWTPARSKCPRTATEYAGRAQTLKMYNKNNYCRHQNLCLSPPSPLNRPTQPLTAAAATNQRNNNFDGIFGRSLQRSFSYVHNPCETAMQCLCNCCDNMEWPFPFQMARFKREPQFCDYNLRSSKSHSFPEGLSYISQQCNCLRSSFGIDQNSESNHLANCSDAAYMKIDDFNLYRNYGCVRSRSHSLSRPIQLLEQITTSV